MVFKRSQGTRLMDDDYYLWVHYFNASSGGKN